MTRLFDAEGVSAAVTALAQGILADAPRDRRCALVGIRRGGVVLAERLAIALVASGARPPLRGDIDITLYRDDLYTGLERAVLGPTDLAFEVSGAHIVLVDDVLFTGRTIRAALGELHDFGRPARVRLAVLVDRGHRELPIAADFVGHRIATELGDRVVVDWDPDEVKLERRS